MLLFLFYSLLILFSALDLIMINESKAWAVDDVVIYLALMECGWSGWSGGGRSPRIRRYSVSIFPQTAT